MIRPLVAGIGGTAKDGSQTGRALGVALRAAADAGAEIVALTDAQLMLPIYQHGSAPSPAARKLIELLRRCDGMIIATPSYHGSISGMIKNALDYAEELRDDVRPYLDGRAVGPIVCAGGWQNVGTTLVSVRSVVHALRGWPTPMGVGINTQKPIFDAYGECIEEQVAAQLGIMGRQVVEFARMQMTAQNALWETAGKPNVVSLDFKKTVPAN